MAAVGALVRTLHMAPLFVQLGISHCYNTKSSGHILPDVKL